MTAATMNETPDQPSVRTAEGAPDTDYETFLRVRSGISDGALRAAGLPPAQELTYDTYRAAFAPKKGPEQESLDRLRGERPIVSAPREEPPGPPPLGRRLILDEAPDGSWRIAADPDRYVRVTPRRRRPFAKLVGMLMGISVAFVVAAALNAALLHKDRWHLATLPFPSFAAIETGVTTGTAAPASIAVTDPPPALQMDTASGGDRAMPDSDWSATTPPAEAAASREMPVAPTVPAPAPALTADDRKPVSAAEAIPSRKAKPMDLPSSTPTATQMRLPSWTPTTQSGPSTTKPASAP